MLKRYKPNLTKGRKNKKEIKGLKCRGWIRTRWSQSDSLAIGQIFFFPRALGNKSDEAVKARKLKVSTATAVQADFLRSPSQGRFFQVSNHILVTSNNHISAIKFRDKITSEKSLSGLFLCTISAAERSKIVFNT
ncbi:hypothetical protein PUN28_008956 [Cardiocondyla obscurior]|uniref:Uncharacterized protein n=1 Tax=Cardiocondyla obscurior TaxID=286306 RepID=A0AAW2FPQ6_9HYME